MLRQSILDTQERKGVSGVATRILQGSESSKMRRQKRKKSQILIFKTGHLGNSKVLD